MVVLSVVMDIFKMPKPSRTRTSSIHVKPKRLHIRLHKRINCLFSNNNCFPVERHAGQQLQLLQGKRLYPLRMMVMMINLNLSNIHVHVVLVEVVDHHHEQLQQRLGVHHVPSVRVEDIYHLLLNNRLHRPVQHLRNNALLVGNDREVHHHVNVLYLEGKERRRPTTTTTTAATTTTIDL